MEQRDYVMSPEYREVIQSKLAHDFWFMNINKPDIWNPDFNWSDNCFLMEWGNGWCEAFYDLCRQLLVEVKADFQWIQLKEKFGTARCYYTGCITPYGQELIEIFEHETKEICEFCGAPGQLRNTDWIKCMCDECMEEIDKR